MKLLFILFMLSFSVAAAAENAERKPLIAGKWYVYKKDAPFTVSCKNPSFVTRATRMVAENIPDPRNNFKQEGCSPDWIPNMGNNPLDHKFKVVRIFVIDGRNILETYRPIYNEYLNEFLNYTNFIEDTYIDPLAVSAPTNAELRAYATSRSTSTKP